MLLNYPASFLKNKKNSSIGMNNAEKQEPEKIQYYLLSLIAGD